MIGQLCLTLTLFNPIINSIIAHKSAAHRHHHHQSSFPNTHIRPDCPSFREYFEDIMSNSGNI